MPSKMPIAEFYVEFFEIKILLLVLVPGTINWNETGKTQTNIKRHTHTDTLHTDTHTR